MLIATLAWSGGAWAWGEATSYVLNDTGTEYELHTISTGSSFTMSGPGAKLSFEAHKDALSAKGLYVEYSTDNNSWTDLAGEISVPETEIKNEGSFFKPNWVTYYNWKEYSFDLPNTNIRYIRFV